LHESLSKKKKKTEYRENLEIKDFNYKLDYGRTIFDMINVFCDSLYYMYYYYIYFMRFL